MASKGRIRNLMRKLGRPLANALIIMVVVAFVVGVVCYGAFGVEAMAFGIAVGIAFGIAGGIAFGIGEGIGEGIAGGIAWGIAVGIAWGIGEGIGEGIAAGIAMGIAMGIAVGIAWGIVWGIVWGIAVGIAVGIAAGIASGIVFGIGEGIAVGIASGIASSLGYYVGAHLRPGLAALSELGPYFRAMSVPLIGFGFVYSAIVVLFASVYASLYRWNPEGLFSNLPQAPSFWDFVFFSITVASQANNEVFAHALIAQVFVSLETVLAIAWLLGGLAAIVAYLEPRFREIHSRHRVPKGPPIASATDSLAGSDDGESAPAD